jgi:hypothetical protein
VSLLGGCVLVDATWVVAGNDPISKVHAVLADVLDGTVPGLKGHTVADALIGALSEHYLCEEPGHAELLDSVGRETTGNAARACLKGLSGLGWLVTTW